jgi:hypothetical protein
MEAPRRLRIADALAIIAATAATLALARYYWQTPITVTPVVSDGVMRVAVTNPPLGLPGLELTASLALASFSPALLWMSLRRPRPPLVELVRRPGVWACLVSTLASGFYLGRHAIQAWRRGGDRFVMPLPTGPGSSLRETVMDLFPLNAFPGLRAMVGPWMIATFVVLLVLGRWRSRAGWVEVAGRCLGASWILLYATLVCTGRLAWPHA